MVVVSNTSPLNYLVLIDPQHILPELFGRILIPAAVRDELQSADAPDPIARFMAAAPAWLETRHVSEVDPQLQHLGRGEREAITLAASLAAGSVLIDERKGRLVARECGLAVSGTLGVLDLAARRGLVNLSEALRRPGSNHVSRIAKIDRPAQVERVRLAAPATTIEYLYRFPLMGYGRFAGDVLFSKMCLFARAVNASVRSVQPLETSKYSSRSSRSTNA